MKTAAEIIHLITAIAWLVLGLYLAASLALIMIRRRNR